MVAIGQDSSQWLAERPGYWSSSGTQSKKQGCPAQARISRADSATYFCSSLTLREPSYLPRLDSRSLQRYRFPGGKLGSKSQQLSSLSLPWEEPEVVPGKTTRTRASETSAQACSLSLSEPGSKRLMKWKLHRCLAASPRPPSRVPAA